MAPLRAREKSSAGLSGKPDEATEGTHRPVCRFGAKGDEKLKDASTR